MDKLLEKDKSASILFLNGVNLKKKHFPSH